MELVCSGYAAVVPCLTGVEDVDADAVAHHLFYEVESEVCFAVTAGSGDEDSCAHRFAEVEVEGKRQFSFIFFSVIMSNMFYYS